MASGCPVAGVRSLEPIVPVELFVSLWDIDALLPRDPINAASFVLRRRTNPTNSCRIRQDPDAESTGHESPSRTTLQTHRFDKGVLDLGLVVRWEVRPPRGIWIGMLPNSVLLR